MFKYFDRRCSKYLDNRAEPSDQPTRQRERVMRGFTSPAHAQRFLSAFAVIGSHFRPRRHRLPAAPSIEVMADRFAVWRETTGSATAG